MAIPAQRRATLAPGKSLNYIAFFLFLVAYVHSHLVSTRTAHRSYSRAGLRRHIFPRSRSSNGMLMIRSWEFSSVAGFGFQINPT